MLRKICIRNLLAVSIIWGITAYGVCAQNADVPAIRPDHPRIFFNSETWEIVKKNAYGYADEYRLKIIRNADNAPDDPHCEGTEPWVVTYGLQKDGSYISRNDTSIPDIKEFGKEAAECALAWRFTQDEKYLIKAKKLLIESIRGYTEATDNRRPVNWWSTCRINAICAYDWIYEALTDDERRSIIVPLVEHCNLVQPEARLNIPRQPAGSKSDGFYGMRSLLWFSGLAAYGDHFCDELAEAHLVKGYKSFLEVMDFRNYYAGDDGTLLTPAINYSMGHYPDAQFNFLYTVESATGKNLANDYPALGLMPYYLWWNWIRDDAHPQMCRYASQSDMYHGLNAENNNLYHIHLCNYLHFYKEIDSAACSIAASLCELLPDKWTCHFPIYPFISGGPGQVDAVPLKQLENADLKARHFESAGQILMRSGWDDNATYCTYTAGSINNNHKHFDENNFIIYKHDHLALDTGCRAYQNDLNLAYYYSQSVAHNVILIQKPDEALPNHWGPHTNDKEANKNYGGQIKMTGAKVLAFETNEDYSYVASDATSCYGEKCVEAVRQFIHIQPDFFVVYDRVCSSDPSYKKEWLIHTQNEPVYEGDVMHADSGEGRLFCQTLLPSGYEKEIIGGPGKEFWVRDRNFDLNQSYYSSSLKKAEQLGRGPYFGAWRVEISPAGDSSDCRFLHVLTATDTSQEKPVKAKLIQDAGRDGVKLSVNGKRFVIWFNRDGDVGGEITVGHDSRNLSDTVLKQSGAIL